jgi:hypothetical protein
MTALNEQGRRVCQCETPSEHVTPSKKGKCVRCDGLLDSSWLSSDQTMDTFWDRLEESLYPNGSAPDAFLAFKLQAQERERAGRSHFGLSYLTRENLREATEEIADAANYVLFDSLQAIRENGEDTEIDMGLSLVAELAQSYEHLYRLRAKRRGAP